MKPIEKELTAIGLIGLATFQVALAAGAPWGQASYGGTHTGVLPAPLRTVSAGAAVLYSGLACAVVDPRVPARVRKPLLAAITGVMALGTALNAVSPSPAERAIWTPFAASLAVVAWRARGCVATNETHDAGASRSDASR